MPRDILEINAGDDWEVPSTVTQEWYGTDVEGTLDVQGTLLLVDNPDVSHEADTDPTDLPVTIDLPMSLPKRLSMVGMGTAVFIGSILALTGGASAWLRNYAAGIMWAFALMALIFSGLFQLGLELFWVLVIGTLLLLIAGGIARWLA